MLSEKALAPKEKIEEPIELKDDKSNARGGPNLSKNN